MIVVVGSVVWEPGAEQASAAAATRPAPAGSQGRAGGLAVGIARQVAASGRAVEIVGKVGGDRAGDDAAVSLGLQRIGHAAVLRDPAQPTPIALRSADSFDDELVGPASAPGPLLERADIELALRYLPEIGVIVVVDGVTPDGIEAAAEGASYAGVHLVVLAGRDAVPADLPATATVLEAPEIDEGPFARLVASYACLLDERKDPADALAEAVANAGWERASS